jgi:hypothetical protein
MPQRKQPEGYFKTFKVSLNFWLYGKLEEFAKKNDMSVRGAVRFIINQFFKGKI